MNYTATTRTRTSLPTFLRERGIPFSTDVVNGRMVYVVNGVGMAYREVATKYGYNDAARNAVKVV